MQFCLSRREVRWPFGHGAERCAGCLQVARLLNERMSIATLLHSELRMHAAAATLGLRY